MTTRKEFEEEVKRATNDTWYLKSGQQYTRATDYVILIHKACGKEKRVLPKTFRNRGLYCKYCKKHTVNRLKYRSKRAGLTPEEFESKVFKVLGSDYKVLTPYINERTYVYVKHLPCGKCYPVSPTNLSRGSGCPKCSSIKGRYKQLKNSNQVWNQETFIERVKELTGDEYIVLGKYDKSVLPVKMRHNKCNFEFSMEPNKFINGNERCPRCARSHAEILIARVLRENLSLLEGKDYIHGYVLPNKLHFDFWFPSIRLAIEYDGKQHYEPIEYFGGKSKFIKQQKNDRIKNQYCKDHDIKLVRIPYTVTKLNQFKEILSSYINFD